MGFDQGNRGDPFRGDYPGRPEHEPWDEHEARVQRDVADLIQRPYEPAVRHELLRLLKERRQGGLPEPGTPRARVPGSPSVTGIDFLPVEVGFDTLHAPGELLITGQSYDGRHTPDGAPGPGRSARRYLDMAGLEASDIECDELRGRVLRLTPRGNRVMTPQELADMAKTLRKRGLSVSLSYITPTAPVTKGKGAPEPASPPSGPPEFGDGSGTPAKVATIDTGISDQPRDDRWLQGVGGDVDPLDRYPLPDGDDYLDLAAGHGTFVAGIVRQVAPRAEVTAYEAVDSDGIGTEVTVACEMIRAVREGEAQIINLSLGCQTHDDLPPIAIAAALDVIGEWERDHGREVLVVAAAGNYGDARPCWPAAFDRVVSVAGLAPDLLPALWSSHGFWVTCSTIGQGVRSTYVEGQESPLLVATPFDFGADAWATWTGTSFAAPQITGALARLHEEYGYPLREALDRLLDAGQPVPGYGQALKILPGV
jgi:subtilisin family serine protease